VPRYIVIFGLFFLCEEEGVPPPTVLLLKTWAVLTSKDHDTKKETKKINKITHKLLAIE